MKIEGRAAIVIGGARGIGQGCVQMLLEHGAKVCIGDILDETGEQVAREAREKYGDSRAIYRHCDVCKDQDVDGLFEESVKVFGEKPEIVITTAAIIDEEDWQRCLDVNVGGCIRLVNAARRHLGKDQGGPGGCVLLTSSVSGIQPEFWGPVYAASKHAITALARSWGHEENFKTHGIRFNLVCPACVDTLFLKQTHKAFHVQWHQDRIQEIRKFTPRDIAGAFQQLIEDDTANAKALRLTFDLGTHYVEFPTGVYS